MDILGFLQKKDLINIKDMEFDPQNDAHLFANRTHPSKLFALATPPLLADIAMVSVAMSCHATGSDANVYTTRLCRLSILIIFLISSCENIWAGRLTQNPTGLLPNLSTICT